jgi:uncharacterized Zn finger protein
MASLTRTQWAVRCEACGQKMSVGIDTEVAHDQRIMVNLDYSGLTAHLRHSHLGAVFVGHVGKPPTPQDRI